jgi:hypothetical protein
MASLRWPPNNLPRPLGRAVVGPPSARSAVDFQPALNKKDSANERILSLDR